MNPQKNFSPYDQWSLSDGTLTERARGWTRSVWDYTGMGTGIIPTSSLGGSFAPKPAVSIGAAVSVTAATNAAPYGYATQAQADDIVNRLNAIRAALVACGILS
jgi:hypothetical protein